MRRYGKDVVCARWLTITVLATVNQELFPFVCSHHTIRDQTNLTVFIMRYTTNLFHRHGLTWVTPWINNHMPSEMWAEIIFSIPNRQRLHWWSLRLGADKQFHLTGNKPYAYLSPLRLKLINVYFCYKKLACYVFGILENMTYVLFYKCAFYVCTKIRTFFFILRHEAWCNLHTQAADSRSNLVICTGKYIFITCTCILYK